jgi:hypothetical protein
MIFFMLMHISLTNIKIPTKKFHPMALNISPRKFFRRHPFFISLPIASLSPTIQRRYDPLAPQLSLRHHFL